MWQGKLLERKENQQILGNHPEDDQGREDRKKKTNSFYYSLARVEL